MELQKFQGLAVDYKGVKRKAYYLPRYTLVDHWDE